MTKKEMEEHHRCDLQDKDRKIKELEDCIIALIQTPSHISVKYETTPWRDRKPEEGEYDLRMRLHQFGNDGTRHVAKSEDYPELLEELKVARQRLNTAEGWAYQELGKLYCSTTIDPVPYEQKELPDLINQAVGHEAIGGAVYEALRILEERVKEQEETNEQRKAA